MRQPMFQEEFNGIQIATHRRPMQRRAIFYGQGMNICGMIEKDCDQVILDKLAA